MILKHYLDVNILDVDLKQDTRTHYLIIRQFILAPRDGAVEHVEKNTDLGENEAINSAV